MTIEDRINRKAPRRRRRLPKEQLPAPTTELERLFGERWADVLDELEDEPLTLTYREPVTVAGFSYRHGEMHLYFHTDGGERKTVPLSDILEVEHEIFSEEEA